jgi:hypothetical protein
MFEEKISMLKHKHFTKHYKKMVAMALLASPSCLRLLPTCLS